jgi:hypothetical protein
MGLTPSQREKPFKNLQRHFGDDREDYDAALQQHYAEGVPH